MIARLLRSDDTLSALAAQVTSGAAPKELVDWLMKLKLMVGVPFHYLVPDNDFLPPETIRFFHVDPNWTNALTDGALSIGRHYNGADAAPPTLYAERAQTMRMHDEPDLAVGNLRRRQLRKDDLPAVPLAAARDVSLEPPERTGFLLNSAAVRGWKSIDVAGYPKGASPYDYEQNAGMPASDIRALDILRLVRLSPSVMLGIFEGTLYELVLHQPPEAIHFGFQTVGLDSAAPTVGKTLRVPTIDWDDPVTQYNANTHQNVDLGDVFVDPAVRVLDMMALSRTLAARLAAIPATGNAGADSAPGYYQVSPESPDYKDHLVASDFGLEMVLGVGLVSFIND